MYAGNELGVFVNVVLVAVVVLPAFLSTACIRAFVDQFVGPLSILSLLYGHRPSLMALSCFSGSLVLLRLA